MLQEKLSFQGSIAMGDAIDIIKEYKRKDFDARVRVEDMAVSDDGSLLVNTGALKSREVMVMHEPVEIITGKDTRKTFYEYSKHDVYDWAFGQLNTKAADGGVPAAYISKCPTWLMAQNINYWLNAAAKKDPGKRLVLRFDGEANVRGVVSERYTDISDTRVIDTMSRVTPDQRIHELVLSPKRTIIRTQTPGEIEVKRGDVVRCGTEIRNSSVGLESFSISSFMLRLVCTNGMTRKEEMSSFSRVHRGSTFSLWQTFGQNLKNILESHPMLIASMQKASEHVIEDMVRFILGLDKKPYELTKAEIAAAMDGYTATMREPSAGLDLYTASNALSWAGTHTTYLSLDSMLKLRDVSTKVLALA